MSHGRTDKPGILIVDDKPMNLISLEAILAADPVDIVKAGSGNEALGLVLEREFALILLDVQMPDMDGFETAELIRSNPKTHHIPIIFISAVNQDEAHLFRGYDTGAVDYLFKPVDSHILRSKIRVFIELYEQKKEREALSRHLAQALAEAERQRGIIAGQNERLKELAVRDGLTGLYNHRHMTVVADAEFNRAIRYKTELSCLMMDLDFFKEVNDSLGHPYGDFVLRTFADCLKAHMRESDFLFRYGGEEFLVLLPQTDLEGARITAEKFRSAIENKVFDDHTHARTITVSIGAASLHYNHPVSAEEFIAFADKALFMAKAQGRNRVVVLHEHSQALPDAGALAERKVNHLKEHLDTILKKTKNAAVASLELLVRDTGDSVAERRSRMLREYIAMMGYHLDLTPSIIETFRLTAVIHHCFQTLLGRTNGLFDGDDPDRPMDDATRQPNILANLAEKFDFFGRERELLLAHHEHYDGSGYPRGLTGEEIPMGARIFAIADFFIGRAFRDGDLDDADFNEALIRLAEESGKMFDPELVAQFVAVLKKNEPSRISPETYRRVSRLLSSGSEPRGSG
jgi:diguanylate cyclase (GGDEF)-like protein